MENKMEAIICSNVNKSYGKKEVLKNIDFTLEKGKIYGLIGRNGAGKTTLLSILSAQNPAAAARCWPSGTRSATRCTRIWPRHSHQLCSPALCHTICL